jgi:hypothetical protein
VEETAETKTQTAAMATKVGGKDGKKPASVATNLIGEL